ncbi:unnamed protein product [Paramecium sonneborni]|uniref:Uncharacterized protein n=1 Tax=Paramecium sonneborni TaxID=65129 RepID=A0A8S1MYN7_9CILI|nr:unnamed protein product [Paramecium sonneborni]
MTSNKTNPNYQNYQKIHQILNNQAQSSPFQHFRQNSHNIKLCHSPEHNQETPLNLTKKTNNLNNINKNLTQFKLCHHKHESLNFEPFQFNNDIKLQKFTQIKSSRSSKINHFDLSKQINKINNCKQENITETIQTHTQFQNKERYDEKILDLLLLDTIELKKILTVNKEEPLKKQRFKPKITYISNTKALPHDFFFTQ